MLQASKVHSRASTVKSMRPDRDVGPLVPFEELVNTIEVGVDESCKQEEDCHKNALEDCTLPDPRALLHVTNRRKVPLRKKSLPVVCNTIFFYFLKQTTSFILKDKCKKDEQSFKDAQKCFKATRHPHLFILQENNEVAEIQAEYEDLLLKFETQVVFLMFFCFCKTLMHFGLFNLFIFYLQRTINEIQFDFLTRKLAEADLFLDVKYDDHSTYNLSTGTITTDKNLSLRESEAIVVIKQLQEQVFSFVSILFLLFMCVCTCTCFFLLKLFIYLFL